MLAGGFIILVIAAFLGGRVTARDGKTPINAQDIDKYIEDNLPDRWSAYTKGVSEGYEQGLRDGQDFPDESA
jgi:hypothetical protein